MNNNNEPLTKKDLTEILGNVIEQNILPGVQSMIDESHNKLHTELDESHNKLRTEIYDLKQDLKKEFIETGTKNKDEIITSNLKLAGKLKNDEEKKSAKKMFSTLANIKFKEHDEIFKDHDQRIKVLEFQPV